MLPPLADTGWAVQEGRDALCKRFIFKGFGAAMEFMSRSAPHCDQLDHHPEWTNVYSRVDVVLTTHDAEGLTELDVTLATLMDTAAEGLLR